MYTDGIIKIAAGKYQFPEGFVARDERERKVMSLQNNGQTLPKELIDYMESRKSGTKQTKSREAERSTRSNSVSLRDVTG